MSGSKLFAGTNIGGSFNTYVQAIGLWVGVSGSWRPVFRQYIGQAGTWRLGYNVAVLSSIVVSPSTATITPGSTQAFSAEGFDSDGNDIGPLTPSWSVSGTCSINSSGVVTSTATEEVVTVTATVGSIVGTASLTVSSS